MEPGILPINLLTAKKYQHFAVSPVTENNGLAEHAIIFFYIGREVRYAERLINLFGCGYTAENPESAISVLKRISKTKDLPDVIIADASFGEQALQELHAYTSSQAIYSLLPFILNASGTGDDDVKNCRKLKCIDEVVYLQHESNEKLLFKMNFLRKVKKRAKQPEGGNPVQTSLQAVVAPKSYSKRLVDILISLFALLVLSPVFLLIALAIKLESRGPVFYIAKRAGKGYCIFNFIKFRTMVQNADQSVDGLSHLNQYLSAARKGPVFFKVINDPRITRVGAFLRKTSLDELPQFFNVLCGDMSLVGNRPLPLFEAATFTTNEWAARFMAPAGITGLWQIKRSNRYEMSVEERIQLDITYAHNYNFMYDLWIMAHTPSALIQKSNA